MKAPTSPIIDSFLICVHQDVTLFYVNGIHIASRSNGMVEFNPEVPAARAMFERFQAQLATEPATK